MRRLKIIHIVLQQQPEIHKHTHTHTIIVSGEYGIIPHYDKYRRAKSEQETAIAKGYSVHNDVYSACEGAGVGY